MADQQDSTYEVEQENTKKNPGSRRGLKIVGIVAGAVVALGAAFGSGVLVGAKLSPANTGVQFGDHFGGPDDDHKFPGGPRPDGDHGGFTPPNGVMPTPQASTTP